MCFPLIPTQICQTADGNSSTVRGASYKVVTQNRSVDDSNNCWVYGKSICLIILYIYILYINIWFKWSILNGNYKPTCNWGAPLDCIHFIWFETFPNLGHTEGVNLRSFRTFVQLMNGRAMMARLKTDINAFVRGRLKVLFHDLSWPSRLITLLH